MSISLASCRYFLVCIFVWCPVLCLDFYYYVSCFVCNIRHCWNDMMNLVSLLIMYRSCIYDLWLLIHYFLITWFHPHTSKVQACLVLLEYPYLMYLAQQQNHWWMMQIGLDPVNHPGTLLPLSGTIVLIRHLAVHSSMSYCITM